MDSLPHSEPLLAACYAASVQGFVATGRRAGQRVVQVRVGDHESASAGVHASGPAHGFSLYAGRCNGAFDRKKREHVIRYMTRPPIPDKRLSFTSNGDVLLELKRPWANGTTHMRFTGTELIERLVSLVPPPRVNLTRYHGVFAPNSRLRSRVVARATASSDAAQPRGKKLSEGRYLDWAQLMARVFEIDVTRCPRCGTRGMQVIACITQPDVIREILTHIGESTAPPEFEPPRYCEIECESAA